MSVAPIAGMGLGVLQRTGALDKIMSKLGFRPDVWTLQVDGADFIRGAGAFENAVVSQTPPDNIAWTLSGQTTRRKMVGDYAPPTMAAGGDPETCTFGALFVAGVRGSRAPAAGVGSVLEEGREPRQAAGVPVLVRQANVPLLLVQPGHQDAARALGGLGEPHCVPVRHHARSREPPVAG